MKKIYLIFFSTAIFAQTPQVITLKDYYKGEGVIFDKYAHYPFEEPNYKMGYTPTIEDIKKAESYMFANYYDYEVPALNRLHQSSLIKKLSQKLENASYVKKRYYKYNRQYAGYVTKSNDTIIYIGLLNFANLKAANDYFEGWKKIIMLGTGGFYYENQRTFDYNLSKDEYIINVKK